MATVTLDGMQSDLAGFLKRVESGETLIVTQANKPIAEIKPVGSSATGEPRPFGLCAGEFTVPADFDAPLYLTEGEATPACAVPTL